MQRELWRVNTPYPVICRWVNQASPVALVDGQNLPEHTRTLLIGWKPPVWSDWTGIADGDATIDVRLRAGGLEYRRRFLLARYRSVELPCGAFNNATVLVTANVGVGTSANLDMVVVASTEAGHPARQEPVIWVQTYSGPDEYVVPYGARRVMSPVADAGFTWKAFAAVTITSPLAANVWQEVAGTRFQLAAFPRTLVWELEL